VLLLQMESTSRFGVEPLGVDFFGAQVLPFAVGAGLVQLAAFDQMLVAILRVRALLGLGLRYVVRSTACFSVALTAATCGEAAGAAGAAAAGRDR
jgi:hypothetical protein